MSKPASCAATPASVEPTSAAATACSNGIDATANVSRASTPTASGTSKPPPPNAWFARGKASGGPTPAAVSSNPSTRSSTPSASGWQLPAHAAKSQAPTVGTAPTASASSAAASTLMTNSPAAKPSTEQAATPVKNLASLLGKPLKVTTTTGTTALGLLWCYDAATGSIVLEGTLPSMSSTDLSSTPYSTAYNNHNSHPRRIDAPTPKTSFRILKAGNVRSVDILSAATAESLGLLKEISTIDLSVATTAAAEAREQAAVKDIKTKAAKIGKGVSAAGQSIFDGLSKTLPCRWHEQHIIIMDAVIVHGPQYDAERTTVPGLTHEQLRALADGEQVALPPKMPLNEAKAKANSWSRVVKVLEGERKRIHARQAAAPS